MPKQLPAVPSVKLDEIKDEAVRDAIERLWRYIQDLKKEVELKL